MSQSASNSNSNSASASSSGNSSSFISIPQTAAAGGLSFTQPATTSNAFYKIASDSPVTFGWNFTSLIVTPTHLTISAICENGNTYPVGPTDGVIDGTATEVVWDVFSYQQANPGTPLAVATYTLTIWDDRGPKATRAGGLFNPNSNLEFALYTPQAYTPLASGWTCPGCSAAEATMSAHPALVAFFATFIIMLLSGWGILRHQ